jgi:hypothetical protein
MYPYALPFEKSVGNSRNRDLSARNWLAEVHMLLTVEGANATEIEAAMNRSELRAMNLYREFPWLFF